MDKLTIMIVAGEASGDRHAAKLVRALREIGDDIEFFGAGGPLMRKEGVDAVALSDELSVVGLAEIIVSLPMFVRAMRSLKRAASERRPDVAVLVDFPDFNLRLAKWLRRRGIRVVYYISPQVWAWRSGRVGIIRKYVDLLISILPFEKEWYARHGVSQIEYVGSPLAREVSAERSRDGFCLAHGLDAARPMISLLPGSRQKEIVRILPVMLDAAVWLAAKVPDAQFVLAAASVHSLKDAEAIVSQHSMRERLIIVEGDTYDALNASDAAAITSGTATLEAGILGTPMVIVYKTSALNYRLFEPMIDVPHYGLINLIAGERVATELIQHEFTSERLAAELFLLLEPRTNAEIRSKLREAAEKLGHGGASKRAAAAILKLISDG